MLLFMDGALTPRQPLEPTVSLSVSRDADFIIADLFDAYDAPEIAVELRANIAHCASIVADGEASIRKYPGAPESLAKYRAALALVAPTTLVNAKISAAILDLTSKGASLQVAVDTVLGAGTYAKIAGATYDALRANVA